MAEAPVPRAPGTPCWVSLMVHRLPVAATFYGALFGWEFSPGPPELGLYVRGRLDGEEIAGIGQLQPERMLRVEWTTYLATDDADATAEAIRSGGGMIGIPPLVAGRTGRLTIASDPAGAVFGTWEAGTHAGTAVAGPPGTPVWSELITPETASIGAFYRSLFPYDGEDGPAAGGADGADAQTLTLAGRPVAALRGVGGGVSHAQGPRWITYFEVEDPDEASRLVTELGGRVIGPPHEEERGRAAIVADPEGALFAVVRSRGGSSD